MMKRLYGLLAGAYFVISTLTLMFFAALLLGTALLEVVRARGSLFLADAVLDSTGLIIIGFAVIETANFIAEEELIRKRELRSARESRRSLTKFLTIIIIAASLEALVMVFKASRADISESIYPAALFVAAVTALVGLGAYQWLSSRINPDGDVRDT